MNENLDLIKILKDCPKGTKLYSPLFGEVIFDGVSECLDDYPITVLSNRYEDDYNCFTKDGRYFKYPETECMLFPSKDNRDWSTFKVPNKLPKTWEEFCENNPIKDNECFITGDSYIQKIYGDRSKNINRNLLPNEEYAEAMLALCQLIQLRDYYNDGWKPDWSENEYKYCIEVENYEIVFDNWCHLQRVLTFKTRELRDTFLNNFKDLIEIAKPLL